MPSLLWHWKGKFPLIRAHACSFRRQERVAADLHDKQLKEINTTFVFSLSGSEGAERFGDGVFSARPCEYKCSAPHFFIYMCAQLPLWTKTMWRRLRASRRWCVFDLCAYECVCALALPGKAPLRQAYTEQLRSSAEAPEAPQRRRDWEVDGWEGKRKRGEIWGGGGGRFSQEGEEGKQGMHRSRWRTDGSDYHSYPQGRRERSREAQRRRD